MGFTDLFTCAYISPYTKPKGDSNLSFYLIYRLLYIMYIM